MKRAFCLSGCLAIITGSILVLCLAGFLLYRFGFRMQRGEPESRTPTPNPAPQRSTQFSATLEPDRRARNEGEPVLRLAADTQKHLIRLETQSCVLVGDPRNRSGACTVLIPSQRLVLEVPATGNVSETTRQQLRNWNVPDFAETVAALTDRPEGNLSGHTRAFNLDADIYQKRAASPAFDLNRGMHDNVTIHETVYAPQIGLVLARRQGPEGLPASTDSRVTAFHEGPLPAATFNLLQAPSALEESLPRTRLPRRH